MSSLLETVRKAADQANLLMDCASAVHAVECDKLKAAIKSANGNIYEVFSRKTNDPK